MKMCKKFIPYEKLSKKKKKKKELNKRKRDDWGSVNPAKRVIPDNHKKIKEKEKLDSLENL